MRRKLTVVPFGGLANRMRAIYAALALAEAHDLELKILWLLRKEELNCPFDELFKPIAGCEVKTLKDNLWWRALLKLAQVKTFAAKVASRLVVSDFYICNHFEYGYFDVDANKSDTFFATHLQQYNYLFACRKFYSYASRHVQRLQSTDGIREIVTDFKKQYLPGNYSGMHIRRTDNIASIENSPLALFEEKLATLEKQFAHKVLLCTDSHEVEATLEQKFSKMLVKASFTKERNSVAGIKAALAEMLLLSDAENIYGSYGSSFSLTAAEIGEAPFTIVSSSNKQAYIL